MERRRNTERLQPEATLGGTVESLSVLQHEKRSEPRAVQKHHEALVARHTNTLPFPVSRMEMKTSS